MEILVLILLVAIGLFFFLRTGTIKYQVEFYIKRYALLLYQGYSKEEAINSLITFYLKNEPSWKEEYMMSRYDSYLKNIDELIVDIILFYFNIDPTLQVWKIDRLSRPMHLYIIFEKLTKYLDFYKKKYRITK